MFKEVILKAKIRINYYFLLPAEIVHIYYRIQAEHSHPDHKTLATKSTQVERFLFFNQTLKNLHFPKPYCYLIFSHNQLILSL